MTIDGDDDAVYDDHDVYVDKVDLHTQQFCYLF